MLKLALIGHNIHYSLSPKVFEVISQVKKQVVDYRIIEISPMELRGFIAEEASQFHGLNVTIPFKEECLRYIQNRSEDVKVTGACNVICTEQPLRAENTDVKAIRSTFKRFQLDLKDKKILVVGAGGAARAVVSELLAAKVAEIHLHNRTVTRAQKIISDFGDERVKLFSPELREHTLDGFVHARPYISRALDVGGGSGDSDFELLSWLKAEAFIFDLVYRPLNVPLRLFAQEKRHKYINGLFMLVEQAVLSFEIWSRQSVTNEEREEIYHKVEADFLSSETL